MSPADAKARPHLIHFIFIYSRGELTNRFSAYNPNRQ